MMWIRKIRLVPLFAGLLALAGCGGPSSSDIQEIYRSYKITDVSCKEADGTPGYTCSFRVDGEFMTNTFVKDDSGHWQYVR